MIRHASRVALVAVALAAAAACSGGAKTGATAGAAAAPAPASNNAAAAKAAPSNKLPASVTTAMVTLGDSIFNNGNCQRCHGKLGVGAANAPAFKGIKWQHGSGSYDDIVKTIVNGVPLDQIKDPAHKFAMAAKGGRTPLSDDQIKAVAAYVFTISR
jgi:mono/diheme cytochrome c family protein